MLLAAAMITVFVVLSDDAFAKSRRHRHHRHHHHRQVTTKAPVAEASFYPSRGMAMLEEAKRWIGSSNPTGFHGPWCGAFQAMVARNVGVEPPRGYLQARQWVNAGRRISTPEVGSIAILKRRKGGHVGVVAGVDENGNPIIVSGNHNRRVGIGVYPSSRVVAYVEPN